MGWFGRRQATSVDAAEAIERVRTDAALLDVREPQEWRAGHAPLATHIPLGRLATAGSRVPRAATVIVVCRSGRRASGAVRQLRASGVNAVNLRGGMVAWERAGGAVVRDGARPGRVV
jgi:rhodanese-related sulfurtransferase